MNVRLPVITSRELLRALLRAGFIIHHQKGSHIYLKHLGPPLKVTVIPAHNIDIKKGTLKSILRQAGLTKEELFELIR